MPQQNPQLFHNESACTEELETVALMFLVDSSEFPQTLASFSHMHESYHTGECTRETTRECVQSSKRSLPHMPESTWLMGDCDEFLM